MLQHGIAQKVADQSPSIGAAGRPRFDRLNPGRGKTPQRPQRLDLAKPSR